MALSGDGYGEPAPADGLLIGSLNVAVLGVIAELVALPADARRRQIGEWSNQHTAQHVAEQGDTVRFGGNPGKVAHTFTVLARILACLACCPGGVRFMGHHWCTNHAACLAADRHATEGPSLLDRRPPISGMHLPEAA